MPLSMEKEKSVKGSRDQELESKGDVRTAAQSCQIRALPELRRHGEEDREVADIDGEISLSPRLASILARCTHHFAFSFRESLWASNFLPRDPEPTHGLSSHEA